MISLLRLHVYSEHLLLKLPTLSCDIMMTFFNNPFQIIDQFTATKSKLVNGSPKEKVEKLEKKMCQRAMHKWCQTKRREDSEIYRNTLYDYNRELILSRQLCISNSISNYHQSCASQVQSPRISVQLPNVICLPNSFILNISSTLWFSIYS